ncbi:MAG: ABC transporter ATP-binding protein [Alphaproteobacteria bacterium]|nr:ABC transporter ATP-binding protein [Alphaproteobacteria bacterium]
MADPVLVLDALSAGYTDTPIVADFSLAVPRGAIVTLIGANGAGKSTLLRAVYGLNRRFGGRILFEGAEIQGLDPAARLGRGVGFVPQGRCNFPKMAVRENLELGAYTLARAAARDAVDRVATMFPVLRARWTTLAGNLSGGEQQILEMAMVLEAAPRLLLLDEPSLGLSPKMLHQVLDTVRAIRDGGVTVLMVEQNARAALRVSDTGVVMELGRKTLEAPAAAVLEDPRVRVAYLGGAPDEAR